MSDAASPPTALVTGATGFVGSHLVEALLARGWYVRCLVRRSSDLRWLPRTQVELAYGDVSNESPAVDAALGKAAQGTTAVFHLAAITSAARAEQFERVNVGGTRRIARAVARSWPPARLVFCSSLAAAGPQHGQPAREEDPPRPESAYGRSKLAAERVLAELGLPHVVVRPPTVYGPRDVDILAAFRLARRGLACRTAPAGQRLSLVHARDLAAGLVLAAERAAGDGRVYYMSDGEVHRWEDVMDAIARAIGRPLRVVEVPRAVLFTAAHADRARARLFGGKPLLTPDRARELSHDDWTCDDGRARAELGYASHIALGDGMRETAEFYRGVGWI